MSVNDPKLIDQPNTNEVRPMTDFDAKLAELEDEANRGRVPELKMVVELLRMLGQKAGISAKSMPIPTSAPMPRADLYCVDPAHGRTMLFRGLGPEQIVCADCMKPKS